MGLMTALRRHLGRTRRREREDARDTDLRATLAASQAAVDEATRVVDDWQRRERPNLAAELMRARDNIGRPLGERPRGGEGAR